MRHFQKTFIILQGCLNLLIVFGSQGAKQKIMKKRKSFTTKNFLKLAPEEQSQEKKNNLMTRCHSQKNFQNSVSLTENIEESFPENAQKNVHKNKLLEKFADQYPFPQGLTKEDFLQKSWKELMAELRDPPSIDFLMDIGLVSQNAANNIDKNTVDYYKLIGEIEKRFYKYNNEKQQQKKGEETEEEPTTWEDVFFIKNHVGRNPSLKTLEAFSPKEKDLNSRLTANLQFFLRQKESFPSENFYYNFMKSFNNIFKKNGLYESIKGRRKSNDELNYLANESENLVYSLKNDFNIFYIKNIYIKLQGILFDNPDFLEDFFFIIKNGDFNQERFKALRDAICCALSDDEKLDFYLCAFSLLFRDKNHILDPYYNLFYDEFIYDSLPGYNFNRYADKIIIDHALEYFNKEGKLAFKDLYFSNKGKNYSYPHSLDKIDFSKGITLRTKTLSIKEQVKNNDFFHSLQKKFAEFQQKREHMFSFLQAYLFSGGNIDTYFEKAYLLLDYRSGNSFSFIAAFAGIIAGLSTEDFRHCLNLATDPSISNSMPLIFIKILKPYVDYCNFSPTELSEHPLIRANNENFYKKNNQTFKILSLMEIKSDNINELHSLNLMKHEKEYIEEFIQEFLDRKQNTSKELLQEINVKKTTEKSKFYRSLSPQNKENFIFLDYFYPTTSGSVQNRTELFTDFGKMIYLNIFSYFNRKRMNIHVPDNLQNPLERSLFIVNSNKKSLDIILGVKEFFVQQKRKEIQKDSMYMELLKDLLEKNYRCKQASIIPFLDKMSSAGLLIFTYCSNYSMFFNVIKHQIILNQKNSLEGKEVLLENIKDSMAQELALFYFENYKKFFIFQGYTLKKNNKDYIDPVFLHLKIMCYDMLAPHLIAIMKFYTNLQIKSSK